MLARCWDVLVLQDRFVVKNAEKSGASVHSGKPEDP
jgi:hypothetical protein